MSPTLPHVSAEDEQAVLLEASIAEHDRDLERAISERRDALILVANRDRLIDAANAEIARLRMELQDSEKRADGYGAMCAEQEARADEAERQYLAVCQALGMAHEPEGQAPSPCSVEEAISAVREMRSEAGRYHEAEGAMMDLTTLNPRADYHEDHGNVLWWKVPIDEPPYCGTSLDDDFPDYVTHWSRLPNVKEPGQ